MKKLLLIMSLILMVSCSNEKQSLEANKSNEVINTIEQNIINFDEQINLKKYFDDLNIKGSITIYDLKNNKWIYSNEEDAKERTLPASTFKIPNSLIILEEKVIENENEVLKWDGVKRRIETHNADTNLKDAFKNSTLWFYQKAAKKVEKEKYKKYLEKFNYGNQNISERIDRFWLDNSLIISPMEQINFLVDFYNEKFQISKQNYDIVKEIMINEKTDSYTLRAKTGWGIVESSDVGWYVGYVETGDNVYFFATRLLQDEFNENKDFISLRKTVTLNILKELNIIK